MAKTFQHIELGVIDKHGNLTIMYPVNTANDVSFKSINTYIPEGLKNLQELVNSFGDMAFTSKNSLDIIYLEEATEDEDIPNVDIVDDNKISYTTTYSSKKIQEMIDEIKRQIHS